MKCGVDVQIMRRSSVICEAKGFIYHHFAVLFWFNFYLANLVSLILISVVLMVVCRQCGSWSRAPQTDIWGGFVCYVFLNGIVGWVLLTSFVGLMLIKIFVPKSKRAIRQKKRVFTCFLGIYLYIWFRLIIQWISIVWPKDFFDGAMSSICRTP